MLSTFGSSAKQAFNNYVRVNSPSFNPAKELGLSPGYTNKALDNLRAVASSSKKALNDYVRVNSPAFNPAKELGLSPGYSKNTPVIVQLSGVTPKPPLSSFSGSSGGFSSGSSGGSAASPALDYYQAALAGHYGMDASTAYQEALANTSYQRSVQDMLNAGLNPASLFAAGRVSGANGVSYASQLGSGFVGSGSSGGGGSARSNQLFSKGLYTALSVVGGGIAVAATKSPFAFSAGQSAAKGVMQAINGLFR